MSLIQKEKEPQKWEEKLWLLITFQWNKLTEEQKTNVARVLAIQKNPKPSSS